MSDDTGELAILQATVERTQQRLHDLLDVILAIINHDYTKRAQTSDADDLLSGLAVGINFIAEELASMAGIFSSMDDALITTDMFGTIRSANVAARNMLGYEQDELASLQLSSVVTSVALASGPAALIDELKFHDDEEARCLTKDGQSIEVSLSASALRSANGEVLGVVCALRDITERKRAERERLQLQEAIRKQAATIEQLSSPIVPLTKDILVMPLVGYIDTHRAQQILEALLNGITRYRASVAILDVTGVPMMDTQIVAALIRAVTAARLIGAHIVLTGIRPDVATTLVSLELDMHDIITEQSLQTGISRALKIIRQVNS